MCDACNVEPTSETIRVTMSRSDDKENVGSASMEANAAAPHLPEVEAVKDKENKQARRRREREAAERFAAEMEKKRRERDREREEQLQLKEEQERQEDEARRRAEEARLAAEEERAVRDREEHARRLWEEQAERDREAARRKAEMQREEAEKRAEEEKRQRLAALEAAEREEELNRQKVADFLHENGFKSANARVRKNVTTRCPLHVAAKRGSAEIVRLLLAAGADPAQRNSHGMTAKQVAEKLDRDGSHGEVLEALGAHR